MPRDVHAQGAGLERLQRWMQEVVVHPGAAAAAQKLVRQQARVFRWFRTWSGEGLFAGVEVDDSTD